MADNCALNYSEDALFVELGELRFMLLLHEASIRATSVGQFEWNYEFDRLEYCSNAYARLFGHHIDHIADAQNTWEKFLSQIHPDDRSHYLQCCNQRYIEPSLTFDYRIVLASGETRHIQETGIYTRPSQEVIRGNFGIVRDISLQKQIESSLGNNEIIGNIHGFNDLGCFLYDEVQERYLYVDESFAKFYGVRKNYLLENVRTTQDNLEIVIEEDREMLLQVYGDAEIGDIWEAEYRIFRPTGEIAWVREIGKSFLIQDEVEVQTIGIVLDISDRKKFEIDLIESRFESENASKAKTEFLSSMSHELRTPMNAILGFANLLKIDQSEPLSEKQKTQVDHILNSGRHLMELIEQVLELNKIEAGKLSINFGKVSAGKTIEDGLQLIRVQAQEKEIEILDQINKDELPILWTDSTRLKQAIVNLLSNAVKYNHRKGSITMTCEVLAEQMLRISVIDTGIGIPREKQTDLFAPFERLGNENETYSGTGIGLAITKQLIELMGGRIGFKSEAGEGSTFWIDIPTSTE